MAQFQIKFTGDHPSLRALKGVPMLVVSMPNCLTIQVAQVAKSPLMATYGTRRISAPDAPESAGVAWRWYSRRKLKSTNKAVSP